MPTVIAATSAAIPSWLRLVAEVEPLFGPMPDFEATLQRNIGRSSAFCVLDRDALVSGGMLLGGPNSTDRWIHWLAVRGDQRGEGVGGALVSEALRRFKSPGTVSLHTFGADNPKVWRRGGSICATGSQRGRWPNPVPKAVRGSCSCWSVPRSR